MKNFFSLITPALAQIDTEVGQAKNLTDYLNLILAWLIPALGGIALLTFIYAGYLMMTSQGNPEAISKAKEIIIVTITGILLLFLARLILSEIGVIR